MTVTTEEHDSFIGRVLKRYSDCGAEFSTPDHIALRLLDDLEAREVRVSELEQRDRDFELRWDRRTEELERLRSYVEELKDSIASLERVSKEDCDHTAARAEKAEARVAELESEQRAMSSALQSIEGCSPKLDDVSPTTVPNMVVAEHMRAKMEEIHGKLVEHFGDDAEHLGQPYGNGFDAILAALCDLTSTVADLEKRMACIRSALNDFTQDGTMRANTARMFLTGDLKEPGHED